jgi:uncharacterized protein involved in exopolysaccharide biosynthesis
MTTPSSVHSDTIDLANVARIIRRGWLVVLACTILGGAAAYAIWAYSPPLWPGKTLLVVRQTKGGAGGLSQLTGVADPSGLLTGGLKGVLETEVQIIGSHSVIAEAVDSFRLQARILRPRGVVTPRVIAATRLDSAFRKVRYSFARQSGGRYAVAQSGFTDTVSLATPVKLPVGEVVFTPGAALPDRFVLELRDREDALKRTSDNLTVSKPGGDLIRITYQGDDSLTAAGVANVLAAAYMRLRKTADRGNNIERVTFLTSKVDSIGRELAKLEQGARLQQEATGVIDPLVVGRLQLERGAELRTALTEATIEEATLSRSLAEVRNKAAGARTLAAFPTFMKTANVSTLLAQLNEAEALRTKALSEGRTTNSREVQLLDSTTKRLEQDIVNQAVAYLATVSQQRRELQPRVDSVQRFVETLPATTEVALRYQREVLATGKLYAAMQMSLVEAKLAEITEGGDVRVQDRAEPEKRVSFPRFGMTFGAGLAGGFGAGIVLALMFGTLGRWARDPDELERSTGLPTLAFDPDVPLLVPSMATRTILVAPIDGGAFAGPVVRRLAETATARSLRATVLDLSNGVADGADVNALIAQLEENHDLVVVHLPGLVSDTAAAALRENRPVLLVTPERRVDRSRLAGAVQLLRRLDVPCAGIVMSGGGRVNGKVPGPAALTARPS